MFNKDLVKFAGVFLILYISAISATPTRQPREAQNIDENIQARDDDDQYQCRYPYSWARRECLGSNGPQAWQDVCQRSVNMFTHFETHFEYIPGSCPDNTYCVDGFNGDGRRFITCISDGKGDKTNPGSKRKNDQQTGTSDSKRARTQLGNTQFEYSVIIDHDMTEAAVAAVLQSECRTVKCSLSYDTFLMLGIN